MRDGRLGLHEEVMLLALHDTKGTVRQGMYGYAVAGALLAELLLAERVTVSQEGRKRFVEVVDATPMRDELLDEALVRMRDAKRRGSPQTWVSRLAGTRKLKPRLAGSLARKGILRQKEEEVLILFRRTVWPTLDPGPERDVVERLRRAALQPDAEVEPRTGVLLSLVHATGMTGAVLDRKERKAARKRIEAVAAGAEVGEATRAAVEAVTAAMIATTAATTAAISAST